MAAPFLNFKGSKGVTLRNQDHTDKQTKTKQGRSRTRSVLMLGPIGGFFGITRERFYKAIAHTNDIDTLEIAIATPGGELWEAMSIYNMIKGHPAQTVCYLIGECASAGTIISSAFDRVVASANSTFMIHEVQAGVYGNKRELEKVADMMATQDETLVDIYKTKTGMRRDQLRSLLKEEKYLSPKQAKRLGFVDEVVDAIQIDFDSEFIADISDEFFFNKDNPQLSQEIYQQHLAQRGVTQFTNHFIHNIQTSNNSVMWNKFLALVNKAGLSIKNGKVYEGDNQLDDEAVETKLNAVAVDSGFDVQAALSARMPEVMAQMLPSLVPALLNQLQTNDQVLTAVMDHVTPKVTEQVTSQLSALRNEVNKIKTLKAGGVVVTQNGDEINPATPGKIESLNGGQIDAYTQSLVDAGFLTAEQAKAIKAPAPAPAAGTPAAGTPATNPK